MRLRQLEKGVESMGHTIAGIRLYSPHDPSKPIDMELLVDSGNTHTWINR